MGISSIQMFYGGGLCMLIYIHAYASIASILIKLSSSLS